MKSYIKCEIPKIDQKSNSLFESFNGVKETEKSNNLLQKILLFCKMNKQEKMQ